MTTHNLAPHRPSAPGAPPTARARFADVTHSEWTKLRTVRSTYWTAALAALATLGIAAVACGQWARTLSEQPRKISGLDPITTGLTGTHLAQLAIGTLGVLAISSEYRKA